MNTPEFRSTKGLFIALLVLTICSNIAWKYPLRGNDSEALFLAAVLLIQASLSLACSIVLVLLVYRTWCNVHQLPHSSKGSSREFTPLAAALPLLIPTFTYIWVFVAFGSLQRLVRTRTGAPIMPGWLLGAFLVFSVLLGLQSTWADAISAGLLPTPTLAPELLMIFSYIAPVYTILKLLAAFFLTRFNAAPPRA